LFVGCPLPFRRSRSTGLKKPTTFKKKFLGTWKDIDFALFTIEVPEADEALLAKLGKNFDFSAPVKGQELMMFGYGIAGNLRQELKGTYDEHCIVFSNSGDTRFIKDPDELNPGEDLVWSYVNGCDISHGDSGSALFSRATGAPVGIIWTGRIPKLASAVSDEHLASLYENSDESMWRELSYGVSAFDIYRYLKAASVSESVDSEVRTIIAQIIK